MKGGKRPGAGRKKGGKNSKSAEIAQAAAAAGITPLEYMLAAMRDTPEKVKDEDDIHYLERLAAHCARADDMAKAAAPYCHPRLAAVEHTGKDGAELIPRKVYVYFPDS